MLQRYSTFDGRPHGAFTDALLGVLRGQLRADRNRDGLIHYRELGFAIRDYLAERGFGHRPQTLPRAHEDTDRIALQGLFRAERPPQSRHAGADGNDRRLRLRIDSSPRELLQRIQVLSGIVAVHEQPADLVVRREGSNGWLLTNPGGDEVGRAANDAVLLERLRHTAWFHGLRMRARSPAPFRLDLELADAARGNLIYLDETIELEVRSERDAWLILLHLDAAGKISPLYPHHADETRPWPAGTVVRVPRNGSLKVGKPLGTDLIAAVAFTERPLFLNELLRIPTLDPDSELFRRIDASLTHSNPAIATLELQTLIPPEDQRPGVRTERQQKGPTDL